MTDTPPDTTPAPQCGAALPGVVNGATVLVGCSETDLDENGQHLGRPHWVTLTWDIDPRLVTTLGPQPSTNGHDHGKVGG